MANTCVNQLVWYIYMLFTCGAALMVMFGSLCIGFNNNGTCGGYGGSIALITIGVIIIAAALLMTCISCICGCILWNSDNNTDNVTNLPEQVDKITV